jgi:hypothetical protein
MTISQSPDNSKTESKSLININKKSSNESDPQLSVSPPASIAQNMQDVEIGSEHAPAIAVVGGEPADADVAQEKGRGGGQGRSVWQLQALAGHCPRCRGDFGDSHCGFACNAEQEPASDRCYGHGHECWCQ